MRAVQTNSTELSAEINFEALVPDLPSVSSGGERKLSRAVNDISALNPTACKKRTLSLNFLIVEMEITRTWDDSMNRRVEIVKPR